MSPWVECRQSNKRPCRLARNLLWSPWTSCGPTVPRSACWGSWDSIGFNAGCYASAGRINWRQKSTRLNHLPEYRQSMRFSAFLDYDDEQRKILLFRLEAEPRRPISGMESSSPNASLAVPLRSLPLRPLFCYWATERWERLECVQHTPPRIACPSNGERNEGSEIEEMEKTDEHTQIERERHRDTREIETLRKAILVILLLYMSLQQAWSLWHRDN